MKKRCAVAIKRFFAAEKSFPEKVLKSAVFKKLENLPSAFERF